MGFLPIPQFLDNFHGLAIARQILGSGDLGDAESLLL
jgi:hypothetical protein